MAEKNENDVLKCIQDSLECTDGVITIDTVATDIETWNSLGHLSILSNLDKEFEGKVASIKMLARAESVKEILQLLNENSLI